jgi:hypothetical protein
MSTPAAQSNSPVPAFRTAQTAFGALGIIGLIGLSIGALGNKQAAFGSFMYGFIFWMTLTMGALTITFLHHAVRAKWSLAILRILESVTNRTLPLMFGLWIVVAIGLWTNQLFSWNDPQTVAASEVLQRKTWWLNPIGWTVRGVLYFAYWAFMVIKLNKSSWRQDKSHDDREAAMRANWGTPGGVIHMLVLTGAVTDWMMSLDPTWYSTLYPAWWMMLGFRAMLALGIIIVFGLEKYRPFSEAVTPVVSKDIGNMLLGFTMLWGYFSLSQYLIIWSGNLPEEIPFFVNRFTGPMVYVGAFLIFAQFFFPFLCLISGRTKRTYPLLVKVAWWISIVTVIDVFWQIVPFFKVGVTAANLPSYLLDFAGWAAVGGLWMGFFLSGLIKFSRENALIPAHDTRLQELQVELKRHEMEHHHA